MSVKVIITVIFLIVGIGAIVLILRPDDAGSSL